MSDSDKTNELDNYGVWVKKPPRTVSSELGEENTDTLSIDNDLPSFDSIDVVDSPLDGTDPDSEDATLSADELANITGSLEEGAPVQEGGEASSSGETEEISLDEFIEGGVFEGDDNSAPAASESSPSQAPQAEESVSTDEFLESSDITVSDAPSVSESAALSDDGPIDIDLSFDDSDSTPSMGSPAGSSAPVKEVAGSEEVDLSDFGVDFGSDDSSSSASPAPSSDGTEEVDLSDFGVDFGEGDSSSAESAPAEEAAPSQPVVNDDGTEEVSLDSFGFDINSDEPKSEEVSSESTSTIIAEENPSLDSDERTLTINDNVPVGSDDEDDIGEISLDSTSASTEPEEKEEAVSQEFTTQDSDDFDLDSIMDSIEDENGNKSSLIDEPLASEPFAEEPAIEEPADSFTEEPVISDAATEDEPAISETLDETEPVVNDVVDMDEPVFEETAVDLPENVADEITEAENPFTLPPDDAFSASAEEPVIAETLDEALGQPASAEPAVTEEAPAFEESIAEEEPAVSESLDESPAEPVKQDEEISSAANNILNQIAAELSSLRDEISNLKSEFEELKNKEPAPAPAAEEEVAEQPAEPESSGGFFGADDEDDTIALSLDEMDNILNTVEIVEEAAPTLPESASASIEEPADDFASEEPTENFAEETVSEGTEESLDFSNESIEEPVLDDIDTNIADDEEELPEEILLPKSEDDILVESSTDNLIEEEEEDSVDISSDDDNISLVDEDSTEDTPFEIEDTASSEASDSTLVDEPFVFDEAEATSDQLDEDENDATLSADELANIAADSSEVEEAAGEEFEESPLEEESEVEAEAESSIPSVSDILGDSPAEEEEESSGISISEGELDNLLSSEAALAEQNRKLAEEEEKAEPVQSSIPGDLQKEIKSVLSYMDQLLENLPEEKIAEFAQSEQFETYKKLFKELGLD